MKTKEMIVVSGLLCGMLLCMLSCSKKEDCGNIVISREVEMESYVNPSISIFPSYGTLYLTKKNNVTKIITIAKDQCGNVSDYSERYQNSPITCSLNYDLFEGAYSFEKIEFYLNDELNETIFSVPWERQFPIGEYFSAFAKVYVMDTILVSNIVY